MFINIEWEFLGGYSWDVIVCIKNFFILSGLVLGMGFYFLIYN